MSVVGMQVIIHLETPSWTRILKTASTWNLQYFEMGKIKRAAQEILSCESAKQIRSDSPMDFEMSLCELPIDIITEILKKLPFTDICSAALVCKQFRDIRDEIHLQNLRSRAMTGSSRSQNVLNLLKWSSSRTEFASLERARRHAQSADEQNSSMAVIWQVCLAQHYRIGCGIKRDIDEATRLLADAAAKGNPDAMYMLGVSCSDKHLHSEAFEWFQKADEKGYCSAAYGMGLCYRAQGKFSDALQAFKRGAEQGCMNACAEYGKCLADGTCGTAVNEPEAVKWLERALAKGNIIADGKLEEIRKRHNRN